MNIDELEDCLHEVLKCLNGKDALAAISVLSRAMARVYSEIIINTDVGIECISTLDGNLEIIKKEIRTRVDRHNKEQPNFEMNQ